MSSEQSSVTRFAINRSACCLAVEIEFEDGSTPNTEIFVQPNGRAKLPDGARVTDAMLRRYSRDLKQQEI